MSIASPARLAPSTDALRREVDRRTARLLDELGLTTDSIACWTSSDGHALRVHLEVDAPLDRASRQALGVRALDALRVVGRTLDVADITVHCAA